MKGLMIKDLAFIKLQKKLWIIIIILSVWMTFTSKESSFIIGYLSVMVPMLSVSTINYDEYDNGNAYLFSLPVSRNLYVKEKYFLSVLLGALSVVLSSAMSLCIGALNDNIVFTDTLMSAAASFCIVLITLSVMLPLRLKFGAEKMRLAIIIISLSFVFLGNLVIKTIELLNYDYEPKYVMDVVFNASLFVVALIVSVLIFMFSMKISMGIMKKKEF